MIIRTIKDYTDRETKKIYRVKDKNNIREVSAERGNELILKGVAEEVTKQESSKENKTDKNKKAE